MKFEQPQQPSTTNEAAPENLGGPLDALGTLLSEESPNWSQAEIRINLIVNEKNPGQKRKLTEQAINMLTGYGAYTKLRDEGHLHLLGRLSGNGESKLEEKAATLSDPNTCDLVVHFYGRAMKILEHESGGDVDKAIGLLEENLEDFSDQDQQKIQKLLNELRDPDFEF